MRSLVRFAVTLSVSAASTALAASSAFAASSDSCAVLPFANAANHGSSSINPAAASSIDWLGLSISETLRDALEMRGLVTLDRHDLQQAFHRLGLSWSLASRDPLTKASVMKIGEALDAEQVIYGQFEVHSTPPAAAAVAAGADSSRGSLKIRARIVDRKLFHESPEFSESGAIEDLSAIEAHLAWQVLRMVAPAQVPPEAEARSLHPAIRLDAEENYIRGLMAADTQQREKFFLQAVRLDARFAHPSFELGQIYLEERQYRQAADAFQKVAPEDIEYHQAAFLLGLALFQAGDFAGSQKALQSIVMAVPLGEVYNNLGAAESRRNNLAQAVEDFRKALEGDPSDPEYSFNLGYALWKKGDFAAAAEQFRHALTRDPDDSLATTLLGRCLKQQGLKSADPGDARLMGLERVKSALQERAYRQLKSVLGTPGGAGRR